MKTVIPIVAIVIFVIGWFLYADKLYDTETRRVPHSAELSLEGGTQGSVSVKIERNDLMNATEPNTCSESLYRALGASDQTNFDAEDYYSMVKYAYESDTQAVLEWGSQLKILLVELNAAKSESNWDGLLNKVGSGEIDVSALTAKGQHLFDLVVMMDAPDETLTELVSMGFSPSMRLFQKFSKTQWIYSNQDLHWLDSFYIPDISYTIIENGEMYNFATYSLKNRNINAYDYWVSKGVNANLDELSIDVLRNLVDAIDSNALIQNGTLDVNIAALRENVVRELESKIDNHDNADPPEDMLALRNSKLKAYSNFQLYPVRICSNSSKVRVIDVETNMVVDSILESFDEKSIVTADIHPFYVDLYFIRQKDKLTYDVHDVAESNAADKEFISRVGKHDYVVITDKYITKELHFVDYLISIEADASLVTRLIDKGYYIGYPRLIYYLNEADTKEYMLSIMKATDRDFGMLQHGKSLAYVAATYQQIDTLKMLEKEFGIKIDGHGTDAVHTILSSPYVLDYVDILKYLLKNRPLTKHHKAILQIYKEYEHEKYMALVASLDLE
ncbi:hypothetical protein [Agaribacter marinus]|uniref:Uncharacterized protein n=1 Tax=Agaribacter marinus TaxID=1431249 RepID=A0AA37WK54_9ALTE|nr:hypothetical protein [Agaribacter marinus]GLR71089.1 hypothetical protein GCM10007852_19970 [Agaribacter marinus]